MKTTTVKCLQCNIFFEKRTNQLIVRPNHFCSNKCKYENKKIKISIACGNCKKMFLRTPNQIAKTKNHFCSSSCAAIYNNKHKQYGYRRSKLEIYLEEQIKINYPNLLMECNNKSIIKSELDFYFPDLKFAIELNGIFHYEPIYGNDKFDKIVNNDKQKFQLCLEHGIELCIIDTSSIKYLSQKIKEQYSTIIFNILNSIIGRIQTK